MPKTTLDYDDLDDRYFVIISNILLNQCYLRINNKKFRLVEIEFYLRSEHHNDEYTHESEDQLLMHTFYFHKFKNGTYRGGTFKGMDLTFGDAEANAYFGILIRAIENMTDDKVIEGPCNVVNKILDEYGCDSIVEFTDNDSMNIFKNDNNFLLVPCSELDVRPLYSGPRIGLSAKFPEYQMRNYRFVADKAKIKKKKNTLQPVD